MPLSLRLSVLNLVISVTKIFPQYPPERHVLSKLFISTSRMQSSCMLGRDDTIRIVPSLVLNFTVIMLLPIATSSSSALNHWRADGCVSKTMYAILRSAARGFRCIRAMMRYGVPDCNGCSSVAMAHIPGSKGEKQGLSKAEPTKSAPGSGMGSSPRISWFCAALHSRRTSTRMRGSRLGILSGVTTLIRRKMPWLLSPIAPEACTCPCTPTPRMFWALVCPLILCIHCLRVADMTSGSFSPLLSLGLALSPSILCAALYTASTISVDGVL
mmetsp:Transcript_40735/g.65589  ORF Transcript_40735/g.65589 Transcript_40735/m.65589 type:complete len:271 (-) Transcript_40735:422-1234(-)